MIIYRVESEDGGGPYNGPKADRALSEELFYSNIWHQPPPSVDIADWWPSSNKSWRYGFESAELLKRWFEPKFYKALDQVGFMVAIYDVPDDAVKCGKFQCAFKFKSAKRLKHVPLAELENKLSTLVDNGKLQV